MSIKKLASMLKTSTKELDEILIGCIKAGTPREEVINPKIQSLAQQCEVQDIESYVDDFYEKNKSMIGYEEMNVVQKIQALVDSEFKLIHNEIHDKRYYKRRNGGEWTMYNDLPVHHFLKTECEGGKGVKGFSDKDLEAVVDHLAIRVNPIKQYFEELPKWNGTDYIRKFTDCFDTTNQEFFYEMLKKHLVRTIKCALESDYENRYLFVFVGGQQSGKTKAVQFLNPFYEDRGYGKYHSHAQIKAGDKDAVNMASQVFIWNVEEFETLRGKEMAFFKGIISQGNTTIRPAYAKYEKEVVRRCSYYASTNKDEFLSDNENTRFLCVRLLNDKTNQIRYGQYNKMGVDKIWQQAWALYHDETFEYELTSAEKEWQAEQNNNYNLITYTSEIMNDLYSKPKDGDTVQYLSLVDIKKDVDAILGDKYNTTSYAIKDAAGHMGIPYKQFWIDGQNIGHKFAVVRKKDGAEDFIPENEGTWKE